MKKMLLFAVCMVGLSLGYAQAEQNPSEITVPVVIEKPKEKLDNELKNAFGGKHSRDNLQRLYIRCFSKSPIQSTQQEAEECVKALVSLRDKLQHTLQGYEAYLKGLASQQDAEQK